MGPESYFILEDACRAQYMFGSFLSEPRMFEGQIDIDRVHEVLVKNYHKRREGKTIANLVTALGEADFGTKYVVIVCHSMDEASRQARLMYDLAKEMGFYQIEYPGRRRTWIRVVETIYDFTTEKRFEYDTRAMHDFVVYNDYERIETIHRYTTLVC